MNHKNRDWLYARYTVDGMTTLEIGDMCGITSKRVCAWLSKHGIPNRRAPVPEDVRELIRTSYTYVNEHGGIIDLPSLSKKTGYSNVTVCRCAKSMGLTVKDRSKSEGARVNMSNAARGTRDTGWDNSKIQFLKDNFRSMTYPELAAHVGFAEGAIRRKLNEYSLKKDTKDIWKYHPHPRGMLGKQHSPDMCIATSERVRSSWNDPDNVFNSDEFRQKKSDHMTRIMATHKPKNPYSRARGGRRGDLNDMYFRSAWEANFARYLNFLVDNGDILKWEYEPDTFEFTKIKRGTRSYTPDFKVFDSEDAEPYYYEVKGWMDAKSKTRLKRMAKYYPAVRVIVFGQKEYTSLKKNLSSLIPNWEHS